MMITPLFHLLRLTAPFVLILAVSAGTALAGAKSPDFGRFRLSCATAVGAAEQTHDIPSKLLLAISHAESGRWDSDTQATIAWPWTVTAEGTGHYLPSRAAAIALVTKLRKRGVRNIDVGCMQVNLRYHPDAFDDLAAAFDPQTNAAYAGRFLAALKRETGSWTAAATRYHSATRKYAVPYRAKVMKLWRAALYGGTPKPPQGAIARTAADPTAATPNSPDAREAAAVAEAHRQAVIAAYLARRAERCAARSAPQLASAAN